MPLYLYPIALTRENRPVLLPDEASICVLIRMDVQFPGVGGVRGRLSPFYKNGTLTLTHHRLIWVPEDPSSDNAACHLPLASVVASDCRPSSLFKTSRIKLSVVAGADMFPSPAQTLESPEIVRFVAHTPGVEFFHAQLREALARHARRWEGNLESDVDFAMFWQRLCSECASKSSGSPNSPPHAPLPAQSDVRELEAALQGMGFDPRLVSRALQIPGVKQGGMQAALDWLVGDARGDQGFEAAGSDGAELRGGASAYAQLPTSGSPSRLGPTASPSCQGPTASPSRQSPAPPPPRPPSAGSMGPGVAGVLLREEMRAAAVSDRMEDALADLERLREAGQAMVALAQGLRARQQPGDAEGSGEALDASTASSLVEFGMLLPTDAGLRGKELARALARQLSEFLRPHLAAAGGLLTLTDAYCLFCRARGVDLVTPDDMVRAVAALGDVPGGIRSRTLRSGVKILHAEDLGGDSVAGAILDLLSGRRATEEEGERKAQEAPLEEGQIHGSPARANPSTSEGLGRPVTAQDVAAALSIPLALAAEHLEDVEARGILCRDESLQGVFFFRNFFVQGA